jgi:cytochrome P450 family 135
MAVAAPSRVSTLPPGPSEPPLVLAARYTWRFPALTRECHERFGASYTLRLPGLAPAVLTTDRDMIRHLVTGDPAVRRHANDILEPALGSRSVMLLEPAPHLERRRLLLPPFHGERIKGYAEQMRSLIEAELDTWAEGEPVQVHERARGLTLSVIEQAVLGSSDPAFRRELATLLDTFASPLANFGLFAPALAKRARWNLLSAPFHRERDRLDALMARQVARARADREIERRTDVLALLLQARDDDGRGLTDADLVDELKTLLIAGHETTATAIGWAADVLAHDPAAARRVREGDRAYVAAAAKEVLRIRTVTPVSTARTLLEPAPLGDRELPAGTVVLTDAHALHADPELWPDPASFRPERFIGGDGPASYSYLPFGGGAHRCLGAALATLELEIALEAMTRRFDLEPVGPPERPRRRGPTHVPANGATVRVHRHRG